MLVEKRNGETQEFDRDKLIHSLVNAGAEEEAAKGAALDIESWAVSRAAEEGSVKSQAIRDKVISDLRNSQPEVAKRYEAYTKTPEEA